MFYLILRNKKKISVMTLLPAVAWKCVCVCACVHVCVRECVSVCRCLSLCREIWRCFIRFIKMNAPSAFVNEVVIKPLKSHLFDVAIMCLPAIFKNHIDELFYKESTALVLLTMTNRMRNWIIRIILRQHVFPCLDYGVLAKCHVTDQ